jgi:DNA-binding transcriptional LysR family regulator
VVQVELLEALDGLIWLRTGHKAASLFNLNQSTVSRNSKRCAEKLYISLVRRNAEWSLDGDPTLLNLERHVHQISRWRENKSLRLEAQHWSAPLLNSSIPNGWVTGNLNYMEYNRPLQLLKERVIDGWITSYPDALSAEDHDFTTICLSKMPMLLVVKEGHPLLELGAQVTFDDVAAFPILPLPSGSFPRFQRVLEQCGLWRNAALPAESDWRGRSDIDDLMVGFATPVTLPMYGDGYKALPLQVPVVVGDALVVAREWANSTQICNLVSLLSSRLEILANTTSGLEVLDHTSPPPCLDGAEGAASAAGACGL